MNDQHASRLSSQYSYLVQKQNEALTAVTDFNAARERFTRVLNILEDFELTATISSYIHSTYFYTRLDVGVFNDPKLLTLLERLEEELDNSFESVDHAGDNYRAYIIKFGFHPGTLTINANLLENGLCTRKLIRVEKREEEQFVKVTVDVPIFEFECPSLEKDEQK